MTQTHPITPPDELLDHCCAVGRAGNWQNALTLAYRAGADQELEACVNYIDNNMSGNKAREFRAIRRPKSPSLKEQALLQLDTLNADLAMHGRGCDLSQIRRALEALND
jgi:hypothetical protein